MIVITTPTGQIGQRLVDQLLAVEAPLRVIARDASKLADKVRDRVEIVEGSHADPAVIDRAFIGADALFWLVPPDPSANDVMDAYIDFTTPAAQALARHGVRRVVSVSSLGRGTAWERQAGYVTAALAMDDVLASSGVAFRAVTCPSFMDNIARQAAALRDQGQFFSPIDGDRKLPSCAVEDIASVSARWLLDEHWQGAGHAAVLGPEDLSFNDMALIMSEVLGKPIRYQQITFEAHKSGLLGRGWSGPTAQALTDMAWAKNQGLDNAEPRTPDNSTPTSFRQWCERVLKPTVLG